MNLVFRLFLIAAVTWMVSITLSFVMIVVTALLTEEWTASRLQPVIWILLSMIVIVFITATVFFHSKVKRLVAAPTSSWLYTVLYACGSVIMAVISGIIAVVALNR